MKYLCSISNSFNKKTKISYRKSLAKNLWWQNSAVKKMAPKKSDSDCGKCTKTFSRSDTKVRCNGVCGLHLHLKCADLSEYDMQVINTKENVIFMCTECQLYINSLETKIESVLKEIIENRSSLARQEEEIKEVLNCVKKINDNDKKVIDEIKKVHFEKSVSETYASVAKKVRPVIIKPKEKQETKVTKEAIKKSVNPKELEIKINNVKK